MTSRMPKADQWALILERVIASQWQRHPEHQINPRRPVGDKAQRRARPRQGADDDETADCREQLDAEFQRTQPRVQDCRQRQRRNSRCGKSPTGKRIARRRRALAGNSLPSVSLTPRKQRRPTNMAQAQAKSCCVRDRCAENWRSAHPWERGRWPWDCPPQPARPFP